MQVVRRREQVDIGQRGLHAARRRRVVAPADQRVQPDDAAAAPREPPHFEAEALRVAGVVAVGDDDERGARIDDAGAVPAVELGKTLTDPRAAADALRHQREPVDRAPDVPFPERARNVDEMGVEDERFRLAKGVDHSVDEADEEGRVGLHRTGRVEQQDEAERPMPALPPDEVDRRPAMADAAVDGAPQVEPPSAAPRPFAPHETRPHAPREAFGERMNLRRLLAVGDMPDVLGTEGAGAQGLVVRRRHVRLELAVRLARRAPLRPGRRRVRRERLQGPGLRRAALPALAQRLNAPHADPRAIDVGHAELIVSRVHRVHRVV